MNNTKRKLYKFTYKISNRFDKKVKKTISDKRYVPVNKDPLVYLTDWLDNEKNLKLAETEMFEITQLNT